MTPETTSDYDALTERIVFDHVLSEAFESGTGHSLDIETDPEYMEYEAEFIRNYLESATDPDAQIPETAPEIMILQHPDRDSFTTEDIRTIAKVSFLGRKLIDKAKQGLIQNDAYQELLDDPDIKSLTYDKDKIISAAFDLLKASDWYENHRGADESSSSSQTPDVGSPLRIQQWPKGDYLNCLGVSIAMSAACEVADVDYMFVNELRSSDSVIAEAHCDFVTHIRRLMPGFFDRPEVNELFRFRDASGENFRQRGDDIFYNMPPAFTQPELSRDFHHSVVNKFYDDPEGWIELDPYALTIGSQPALDGMQELHDFISTPANATALANVNFNQKIKGFFRSFNRSIRSLHSQPRPLSEVCREEEAYKSSHIFQILADRLKELLCDSIADIYPDEDETRPERIAYNLASVSIYDLVAAFHTKITGDEHSEGMFASALNAIHDDDKNGNDPIIKSGFQLYSGMQQKILDELRRDTKVREQFYEYLDVLPYVIIADLYRYDLLRFTSINKFGAPDITAEYCQPEFMIGAMYLNHFATWRKGGRVNVASYLANVCPSQLLWQASLQDGEENERARAVGRLIAGMRPSQLHPRVEIARTIVER